MKTPVVAVIGRPNVGKSTLVNRIIGSRQAIVDDLPGVTRDRCYYDAEWNGKTFQLMDTGGIVPESEDVWEERINQQVEVALLEADVVVFLVDGQSGATAVDEAVAQQIRRTRKPVILVVNKIDKGEQRPLVNDFYALGLGDPLPLSAMHGSVGVGDLLDEVIRLLPQAPDVSDDAEDTIKIALVGRPNVGKSSILNALLGEHRTIVSDIPGTTRDAIDVTVEHQGQRFTLVDTAGIRKKGKVEYGVEMFSVDRSLRTLRQSDVTVLVLDANEGVTDQDKRIIETSNDAGRALVLVVNKWDTIPDKTPQTPSTYKKTLYHQIPHAAYAEMTFTSAMTGQRLNQIYALAQKAAENHQRRVKTSLVNQVIMEAVTLSPPPPIKNKRLKILYATQVSAAPPTFVLFVNDDKLMKDAYRRYLERKLRESFEFTGTPLVLLPRSRGEKA